jgi:MFS family permease
MLKNNRIRQLPRNIWVLTGGSFLTDISSEMIVHLIPLFLANILGVRTITIGLIEGVAETTASLLKVFSGRYSDRLGQRKWLTVAGYSLSTLAKPFLVLANSWTAVFAVRFTDRVGKGIRTAPRDALVADSIEPEHRGLAFGLHRAGDTAGAALGLLIAFLVVWLTQGRGMVLQATTFHTLVWISVIPAVLAVVLLIVGIREVPVKNKNEEAKKSLAWRDLRLPFKRFLFVISIFTLGNSADAFLILRAQERGLSVLAVMALLVAFNVIYAVISGPASAISDKIGRCRLLVSGWLLYALLYAGFALAQTGWQIGLLFAAYGVYYGLTEGSAKAFVADLVLPEQRGTAYGFYNAAIGMMALPASLLAGLLWQGAGGWPGFGPAAPFVFGSVLALAATFMLVSMRLTIND